VIGTPLTSVIRPWTSQNCHNVRHNNPDGVHVRSRPRADRLIQEPYAPRTIDREAATREEEAGPSDRLGLPALISFFEP